MQQGDFFFTIITEIKFCNRVIFFSQLLQKSKLATRWFFFHNYYRNQILQQGDFFFTIITEIKNCHKVIFFTIITECKVIRTKWDGTNVIIVIKLTTNNLLKSILTYFISLQTRQLKQQNVNRCGKFVLVFGIARHLEIRTSTKFS